MKQAKDAAPISVRAVADADGTAFILKGETNEGADVSVIEPCENVWSCACTHGCVFSLPSRLTGSASAPTATLLLAAPAPSKSFSKSAPSPMAVLLEPRTLEESA